MAERMYTETSIIVRRGAEVGTDQYGEPVYDSTLPFAAPCWYTHREMAEDDDGKDQTTSVYLIQWPPRYHSVVRGCDRIMLPIGVFEPIGEVAYQPSGFVVEGYVQTRAREVIG